MVGHFDMCTLLIEKGADVRAARRDGASPLSMSILSGSTHLVKLFTKSIAGYPSDPIDDSFMQNLAQAHLDVRNLDEWLRGGTAPLALKGHIGALLLLSVLYRACHQGSKEQLHHVRALLDHNEGLLERSSSQWPVAHAVLQLVSQETDKVFAHAHTALGDEDMSGATRPRLIHWLNKPTSHRCRFTMRAGNIVNGIAYSKCGRKLALAVDKVVNVCDAETGFVESTLTGHRYVPFPCIECFLSYFGTDLVFLTRKTVASVAYSPCGKWIASGSWDKTVRIWNAATGAPVGSPLSGHDGKDGCICDCDSDGDLYDSVDPQCLVRGHGYVPFPCIECLLL